MASFLFINGVSILLQWVDETLLMLGFKQRTSGVGSNRSTIWATNTAQERLMFTKTLHHDMIKPNFLIQSWLLRHRDSVPQMTSLDPELLPSSSSIVVPERSGRAFCEEVSSTDQCQLAQNLFSQKIKNWSAKKCIVVKLSWLEWSQHWGKTLDELERLGMVDLSDEILLLPLKLLNLFSSLAKLGQV